MHSADPRAALHTMAARKKPKKTKDDDPQFKASRHPSRLMEAGGVARFERDAVRKVREHWLEVCERWQEELPDHHGRNYAEREAQHLRRQLRIKAPKKPPDLERIREQTRERVRRYRERQKKG